MSTRRHIRTLILTIALLLAIPAAAHAEFGIKPESFVAEAVNANGSQDTQAGSHPFAFTTAFSFDTLPGVGGLSSLSGNVKDIVESLPPGLVGDPQAVAQCSDQQLTSFSCPTDSQIGVTRIQFEKSAGISYTFMRPVFNMVPSEGQPAALGIQFGFGQTQIGASVRNSDYGLNMTVTNFPELPDYYLLSSEVTVWGVPAASSHNAYRGKCLDENENASSISTGLCESTAPQRPFLTLPTSCPATHMTTTLAVDSWQEPTRWVEVAAPAPSLLDGCARLEFKPTIRVQPSTSEADAPSGLSVALTVPQNEQPEEPATPTLRDATVVLPEGMAVNPSEAAGLRGCTTTQIALNSSEAATCPSASQIGTVEIHTPLLERPLQGQLYLAAPECSPCSTADAETGKLLKLYIQVQGSGVTVKLPGTVSANPATGQLTATFNEDPQLPFSELAIALKTGPRAPLTTPLACGTYDATSALTPWSTPYTPTLTSSDSISIVSGPNGSGCVASEAQAANAPSFEAGTANPAAGAYTPFVLRLSRQSGSQQLKAINVALPPGLAGKLAGVAQCSQPDIEAAERAGGTAELAGPSCPATSELGTVTVGAGSGAPFDVGGHVYLAGPYKGAPFSLVIVTPAVAGPFDLGTVVVRAALFINPHTAQVTVQSDPIPSILDGIPLDIRSIDVEIVRQDFTFNPTSCEPMSATGAVESLTGATAALSDRFQAADCASLAFAPTFRASTSAKTSKKYGASLHVSITYPKGAAGKDANLGYAKVELPKALPSELETLKEACLAKVFEANPAECPSRSIVGHAVVHTPVLPVSLQGPAYFVSHGGQEFPSLTMVLQGDGVTIELVGDTFIKKGVTSSTFKSTPDIPFESFELTLPEQKYSALGANGNLCEQKLVMPTRLIGQNGAEIEQSTRIEVQGCANKLTVVSHKLKGNTLTLKVAVPAAGKLTVSGDGVSSTSKTSSGREPLTLKLQVKKGTKTKIKGKHGKSKAKNIKIKVSFKPLKGKKLTKTVKASV